MVLYTPAAEVEAGGQAAITAQVQQGIAQTNLAFANSRVHATLRCVDLEEVQYAESGSLQTDLDSLRAGEGAFSGVAGLRAEYGADLVSLWTAATADASGEAGLAFQPQDLSQPDPTQGYSVVEEKWADDNYVFAHEIGHNLGAGHDRSDPSPRAIPYAYGQTMTVDVQAVGDIMSDGVRVPYFSNPAVKLDGVATGSPDNSRDPADNARVMNQFAPVISGYENSVVADTNGPVAELGTVQISAAHVLWFQVRYADDTAVAARTLGSSDIVVSGPNGFQAEARFSSAQFGGNVAQQTVTYHVNINGSSAVPSDYSFALRPGGVSDVWGNACPGGPLETSDPRVATLAGPRLAQAQDLGALGENIVQIGGSLADSSAGSFYRFRLIAPMRVACDLADPSNHLTDLLVSGPPPGGTRPVEQIVAGGAAGIGQRSAWVTLARGTYYAWVAPSPAGMSSTGTANASLSNPFVLSLSASRLASQSPRGR
jgi:hypothetical protein